MKHYTQDQIEDVTGLSMAEIALAIRDREFPRGRQITPEVWGWDANEVKAWELAKQKGVRWRPPVKKRNLEKETELYRHFDSAGRLLYVGVSLRSTVRLIAHVANAKWADQIATITIERFPTRKAALQAERAAIQAEKPLHNIAHASKE